MGVELGRVINKAIIPECTGADSLYPGQTVERVIFLIGDTGATNVIGCIFKRGDTCTNLGGQIGTSPPEQVCKYVSGKIAKQESVILATGGAIPDGLRALRQQNLLTLREVGSMSYLTHQAVFSFEQGRTHCINSSTQKIADILDVRFALVSGLDAELVRDPRILATREAICDALKLLREEKQLTKKRLAELTGLQSATIGRIENGRVHSINPTAQKIAALYDAQFALVRGGEVK